MYGEGALIHSSGEFLWGGTVRSTEVAKGIPLGQMTIKRMWVLVGPKAQVASSRLSQKGNGEHFVKPLSTSVQEFDSLSLGREKSSSQEYLEGVNDL